MAQLKLTVAANNAAVRFFKTNEKQDVCWVCSDGFAYSKRNRQWASQRAGLAGVTLTKVNRNDIKGFIKSKKAKIKTEAKDDKSKIKNQQS